MSSKRIFSWSKRQSGSEVYYRTGGIVPIDASPDLISHGFEAKVRVTPNSERKRPSDLKIVTDNKQVVLNSRSSTYNVALVSAASNLQAVFNDILRSPAPFVATCPRSASVLKPLPSRPRSLSLPSSPKLPVELPGSILQENQGFPPCATTENPALACPTIENTQGTTRSARKDFEDQEAVLDLLDLFAEPLAHARSVPDLGRRDGDMRSVRSGNALNSTASVKSSPSKLQHKKLLSETSSRRRSRTDLLTSPSASDPKLTALADGNGPDNSGRTRNARKIEELKATISNQDHTISTLQSQFSSLRASHESHIASLTDTHLAEVASLKNYARVLEDQLAHRPSLHHASSNNLLFVLDTTEPRTPIHESSQPATESGSATSTKSFRSALEKQSQSPQRPRNSPEMESLKRKLSTTRRPETTNRNLLPELNQYKQNNVALQYQIESLMAKLNESKKNERALKTSAEEAERQCEEWREKAAEADKMTKSAQSLQNTIDHLENRLEIANIEKLDAQEQLYNVQSAKSPFELPKLQAAKNTHLSMSTVFSSDSPVSHGDTQELSTLAAFVAHIERLQDQVRQKDATISDLEANRAQLQQRHEQLERDQQALGLQMGIQNELMRKTRQSDSHIEQLRAAIIERETIIGEKEKSMRILQRQLDRHKLLLQAQIRRNATMTLHITVDQSTLPELGTLAKRADIDKWVEGLQDRLKKEKTMSNVEQSNDSRQTTLTNLRDEIDFYVREIILYKLDIRGYKSDIKKLKKITTQLSTYGSRASDLGSDTSSLRPAGTPNQARFSPLSPEIGSSGVPSPILEGPRHGLSTVDVPQPIPDGELGVKLPTNNPNPSREREDVRPDTSHSASHAVKIDIAGEADCLPHEVASSPVECSFEERRPTSPSPALMKFSDLLHNVPEIKPLPSLRHGRSMSESILPSFATSSARGMAQAYAATDHLASSPSSIDITSMAGRDQEENVPQPSMSRQNSNASAVRVVPPHMARDMRDSMASSPSPMPPSFLRSRAGSAGSSTANNTTDAPPERKLSTASSSSVPFVIGMGSPHNPTIVPLAASMPLTSCSITRNAPLKISTSRVGVGGTMASCMPVTSPVSPTNTSRLEPPTKVAATKPTPVVSATPSRKFSLSRNHDEQAPTPPRTPSHSRTISGGSIRTAIRLPRTRDKEKVAHKMRKDSIGMPQPLGSPFAVNMSASESAGVSRPIERGDGEGLAYSIGEAI
ncbi:hypothetical protein EK21DRAFT_78183 [Setomelanomma holmii]|uniref:Uncharacterized protein n=1 Tax=Setomelanomma holmii TaxID=210430 RepID=A0A9P4GZA8_9PLEO|nr:hypothetical protein EK21DRAFT_78183 [Setomelanomma holmii]